MRAPEEKENCSQSPFDTRGDEAIICLGPAGIACSRNGAPGLSGAFPPIGHCSFEQGERSGCHRNATGISISPGENSRRPGQAGRCWNACGWTSKALFGMNVSLPSLFILLFRAWVLPGTKTGIEQRGH